MGRIELMLAIILLLLIMSGTSILVGCLIDKYNSQKDGKVSG